MAILQIEAAGREEEKEEMDGEKKLQLSHQQHNEVISLRCSITESIHSATVETVQVGRVQCWT